MRGLRWTGACALAAALCVGCGDDDGDDGATVDAAAPTPDAAEVVGACPAGDPAGPTGGLVLFLNFDGVTITPGPDDPAANVSSIVSGESTIPPAFDGDAQQDVILERVEDNARALLGPFDVGVVTERPASGTYSMIVVGGRPEDIGLSAGIGSLAPSGCTTNPAFVGFVFGANRDPESVASGVGFVLGASAGIPLDESPGSCTCNVCTHTELCTVPDEVITAGVQNQCGPGGEYNPALAWKDRFGCRR